MDQLCLDNLVKNLGELAQKAVIGAEQLEHALSHRDYFACAIRRVHEIDDEAHCLIGTSIDTAPQTWTAGTQSRDWGPQPSQLLEVKSLRAAEAQTLAQLLDSVIHQATAALECICDHQADIPIERCLEMATVIRRCSEQVRQAVSELEEICEMPRPDVRAVFNPCMRVSSLSKHMDALRRDTMREILHQGLSAASIGHCRNAFDHFSTAARRCQDASDLLEAAATRHICELKSMEESPGAGAGHPAQEPSQALYDGLCCALRRSLSDGGHVGLTAALRGQCPQSIATALNRLTDDEAQAVFNWLDDDRAILVLPALTTRRRDYLLRHGPAGRISELGLQSL